MRHVLQVVVVLVFAALSYAVWALLDILEAVRDFRGTCPAAPTDVPPYPCTVLEYFDRMTAGPWAFLGHVVVFAIWAVGCLGAWFGVKLACRFVRRLR